MGENSQTLNDVNDMENRSNQDCDNGIPAAFSQLNQNVNANFTSITVIRFCLDEFIIIVLGNYNRFTGERRQLLIFIIFYNFVNNNCETRVNTRIEFQHWRYHNYFHNR